MALWKDNTAPTKDAPVATKDAPVALADTAPAKEQPSMPIDIAPQTARRVTPREMKESVIAAEITISGKIDGAGHVRIAGRFEGDVNIKGDLTIEPGAALNGGIRAETVAIGGAVEGNIESARTVELLSTGLVEGDIKAGTLTVAAGSRMRGRVEFGWGDETPPEPRKGAGKGS
ncbi:MAG TPA: polymer-forming cytoskeletal protein [Gemmatimonadaceae bacterium]|nr:polymer-forming cytoskeletal protein [Gemmatimonadaceae bacterium]